MIPILSPRSPLGKESVPPVADEQIVNSTLFMFLMMLTCARPDTKAVWTTHRGAFRIPGIYQAQVDGYLRRQSDGVIGAILEVNKHVRKSNKANIQTQETAQVAAWIHRSRVIGSKIIKQRSGETIYR